jgi:agmatine/peptidylarginine deiminase
MLTWPHGETDWAADLAAVEVVYRRLVHEIALRERVLVVTADAAHRTRVRALLAEAGVPDRAVRIAVAASNDTWARDHGPITVLEGERPRLLDLRFNGWGGKYPAGLDNAINRRLAASGLFGSAPLEAVGLVLEGGAIETDGEGTLLARASAVVDGRRNPGLGRLALEARLRDLLGLERFLWLEHGGLLGDDTDGHIDTLARFVDAQTLVYQGCEDPADPQFPELRAMAEELAGLVSTRGRPYRRIPLPLPGPIEDADGRRLPASYANFLIINGAVLLPVYGDPADGVALDRLTGCFPGRAVIGIDCRALIRQNGSLHCITMQLPTGVLA